MLLNIHFILIIWKIIHFIFFFFLRKLESTKLLSQWRKFFFFNAVNFNLGLKDKVLVKNWVKLLQLDMHFSVCTILRFHHAHQLNYKSHSLIRQENLAHFKVLPIIYLSKYLNLLFFVFLQNTINSFFLCFFVII